MDVPIPTSINIILYFSIDTLWDLSNNTEQSMFSWHVENRFEFLVTLRESEKYQVYTHSRRLIRHVKFNGDVIREYEYHKDGQTRLFTLPYRVIQNRNTDICVVNKTSGSSSEPMILSSSGCVNVVSRGQAVVKKCLFCDVVCDSHSNIILSDMKNGQNHFLSPNGEFAKYLLTQDEITHPSSISIFDYTLLVGHNKRLVKSFFPLNTTLPRHFSYSLFHNFSSTLFLQSSFFPLK